MKYQYSQENHNLSSAQFIAPLIMKWFNPQSIIDVGCGLGEWMAIFMEHGVNEILGIEMEEVDSDMLYVPKNKIIKRDLRAPFSLDRKFDLALCLEVAEHLPVQAADQIVQMLTDLSDIILFSAAIPGQGGQNHLNEQSPVYWQEKFKTHGYAFYDNIRFHFWQEKKIKYWYKQNLFLIIKEGINHPFKQLTPILEVVHPELLEKKNRVIKKYENGQIGIKTVLKMLQKSILYRLKNHS